MRTDPHHFGTLSRKNSQEDRRNYLFLVGPQFAFDLSFFLSFFSIFNFSSLLTIPEFYSYYIIIIWQLYLYYIYINMIYHKVNVQKNTIECYHDESSRTFAKCHYNHEGLKKHTHTHTL